MTHTSHISVPNLLSGFRIVMGPAELALAYSGQKAAFLVLLILCLLSDAVDGYIARRQHCVSAFGARLDSWGDLVMFLTLPLSVWWLWPELVRAEAVFIALAIASYLVPVGIGGLRFRHLTSYHTWTAKLSTILFGVTVFYMLLGGSTWPFRVAVPVFFLSALENIAITFTLKSWRTNVHSIWHAVRIRREQIDTEDPTPNIAPM